MRWEPMKSQINLKLLDISEPHFHPILATVCLYTGIRDLVLHLSLYVSCLTPLSFFNPTLEEETPCFGE